MEFNALPWLADWNLDPGILLGLGLVCGAYLYGVGPLRRRLNLAPSVDKRQVASFLVGVLVIFVALVLPVDEIGDRYLFSVHMVQHLLLTLVMAPLLLLGTPGWLIRPVLKSPAIANVGQMLTRPVTAFVTFNLVFAAYHVPALYEMALENETLHIFVHLLLMITAVITWWPILSPLTELPRLPYPTQILYLFFQAIPPTLLGALITFANTVFISTYASAPRIFGISAIDDQQLAGLIMWIPGSAVYLFALTLVFFKWFGREEESPTLANGVLE
jgi:putative membrane protein